jgi:predicted ArsR family transcriptional regulator
MPAKRVSGAALRGTRGKIIELLRRSDRTANEIAAQLDLTHNAVRGHLAALLHEGLVREVGSRPSGTRPAAVYALVPGAEAIFSRAYVPFVAHLVRILQERLDQKELDEVMHLVGRGLASEWPRVRGDLQARVDAAAALLEELGAPNEVEQRNGGLVIRGYACLLSEAVHRRPEVCRAMESLVTELVEGRVRECCDRAGERPRCCFEITIGRQKGREAIAKGDH